MKRILNISVALLMGAAISGCRKPHRPPPLEQMALTARFFRSVSENQSEQAIRQGRKLLLLSPESVHISALIALQEANDTIGEAQNAVENGDINRALEIIREGRNKHVGNRTFSEVYPQVFQLRNAGKLLKAMLKAKNSSSMRGARIAARSGLSLNMTPELEKYLADYELRGAAVAAREREKSRAAERAAQEAALRAKNEERTRRIRENRFSRDAARKSAEGERLRQQNRFPEPSGK